MIMPFFYNALLQFYVRVKFVKLKVVYIITNSKKSGNVQRNILEKEIGENHY